MPLDRPLPDDTREALKMLWSVTEEQLIDINRHRDSLHKIWHVPPVKPREGLLVYADGTHWNPGSGAGYYVYYAGAWHPMSGGGGGGGGITVVQDEGVALPVQTTLNFVGAGVTATNDAGGSRTTVTISGGGAGSVTSVFTRTGAVVAVSGDYTAAQVTNAVSVLGSYANPVWITSLAYSKLTGVPTSFTPAAHVHAAADTTSGIFAVARLGSGTPSASNWLRGDGAWTALPASAVTSVFTRTGAVVAASGDYTAAQVTNAVSTLGSYADPAWITSLAYAKITGAPAAGVPTSRQVIAGTGMSGGGALTADVTLNALPMIASGASGRGGTVPTPGTTAGTTKFLREDATWVVPATGGSQTPWLTDIDGNNKTLKSVLAIGVAVASPGVSLDVAGQIRSVAGAVDMRLEAQSAVGVVGTMSAHPTGIWAATAERVRITTAGQVGIGTTNPQASLSINDLSASDTPGSSQKIQFLWNEVAVYGWRISADLGALVLDSVGAAWQPSISVSRAANYVGIGLAAPTHSLHVATDDAAKLSTGTWTVVSDARTKKNIRDLEGGLDVISRLRPVEAEFNGLAGTPEGHRVVSFLADEIREVLPHTVGSRPGKIGEEKTDVLDFNMHEVLMHLVLAVKQLAAARPS
jgi:hypothetical protein